MFHKAAPRTEIPVQIMGDMLQGVVIAGGADIDSPQKKCSEVAARLSQAGIECGEEEIKSVLALEQAGYNQKIIAESSGVEPSVVGKILFFSSRVRSLADKGRA